MQKTISSVCKKSIWIVLVCLFIVYPVMLSYETGLSCGLQIVRAAEPSDSSNADNVSNTATYDNWLEGWGTGDVYSGATLSVDDFTEKNIVEQYIEKRRDWYVDTMEVGLAIIIKVLVVGVATSIVEDLGATIDQVVYGRVATGDDVSKFHFGLEDGNIFGVVGAIIYAILRGFVFALLAIQFLYMIGTYMVKGTGKGRSDLKSSVYDFVFMFVMLYAMPIIVSMILFLRDSMVKKILDVTNAIAGSYSLGIFDMMMLGTAEDFSLSGAIVMSCVAAGGLYFAYEYIRMAITQVYLFGSFPMVAFRSFSDKQVFNKWIGHFIVTLFVPVIDAAGLMIVLLLQENMTAISAEDGHYGLLMVMAYLCVIPCRNALLQLFGAPVPNRGFSLAAAALMAARLLGGGKGKDRPSDKKTETGNSNGSQGGGNGGEGAGTGEKPLQNQSPTSHQQNNENIAAEDTGKQLSTDTQETSSEDTISSNTIQEHGMQDTNVIESEQISPDDSITAQGQEYEPMEGDIGGGGAQYDGAELREMARLSGDMPTALDFEPSVAETPIDSSNSRQDMPELAGQASFVNNAAANVDDSVVENGVSAQSGIQHSDATGAEGDGSNNEQSASGEPLKQESDNDATVNNAGAGTDSTPIRQPDPELAEWQSADGSLPAAIPKDMEGIGVATRICPDGTRQTLVKPEDLNEKSGKSLSSVSGISVGQPDNSSGVTGKYATLAESKESWLKPTNTNATGGAATPLSSQAAQPAGDVKTRYEQMRNTPAYNQQGCSSDGLMARNADGSWDYKTDFANAARTLARVTTAVSVGGTAAAVMAASGDPMTAVTMGAVLGAGAGDTAADAGTAVGRTAARVNEKVSSAAIQKVELGTPKTTVTTNKAPTNTAKSEPKVKISDAGKKNTGSASKQATPKSSRENSYKTQQEMIKEYGNREDEKKDT